MSGISAETAAGALAGLVVAGVILALLLRARVLDMTFDERQERARGTAYKYAFIATLITAALCGGAELLLGRWCDAMTGAVLCFCVGGGVFASTCIVKGAYVSLREKPRQILVTLIAAAAINLICGMGSVIRGGLVEGGVLTYRAANLLLGITCLAILLVYLAAPVSSQEDEA